MARLVFSPHQPAPPVFSHQPAPPSLSHLPALSPDATPRPSRAAMNWLRSLPEVLQPVHLMRREARLCSLLCHRWADAGLALRFVDDLLLGSIGGAPRFDEAVRRELRALAEHLAWRVRHAAPR